MKMEKRLVFDNIAKEAHANVVEHGFWDVRMSNEHYLMLVISEVAEAVEADRKGNWACDKPEYDLYVEGHKSRFITFKESIKDTVEDELADVVIRLCDLAGAEGIEFDKLMPLRYIRNFEKFSFSENAFALCKGLCKESIYLHKRIQWGLWYVQAWAQHMNINLEWHVTQKMAINATRPAKHGKAY